MPAVSLTSRPIIMRPYRALRTDQEYPTLSATTTATKRPSQVYLRFISNRAVMCDICSTCSESPNDQHQRREPASTDTRLGTEPNGWLPSAECCGWMWRSFCAPPDYAVIRPTKAEDQKKGV